MVKGAVLGVLDEPRSQSLFEQKIPGMYVMPLATMTGSKAADELVVVLDRFPSGGRCPDRRPLFAQLILRTSLHAPQAVIECVLGEKKRSDFAQLDVLVAEYRAQGMWSEALAGEVVERLPRVVEQRVRLRLFMFLGPRGASISYADLVAVLARPRRSVWPPADVLLSVASEPIRRVAAGKANARRRCVGVTTPRTGSMPPARHPGRQATHEEISRWTATSPRSVTSAYGKKSALSRRPRYAREYQRWKRRGRCSMSCPG